MCNYTFDSVLKTALLKSGTYGREIREVVKDWLRTLRPKKENREELQAIARVIREGGKRPIPLWHQVKATDVAQRVEGMLGGGRG